MTSKRKIQPPRSFWPINVPPPFRRDCCVLVHCLQTRLIRIKADWLLQVERKILIFLQIEFPPRIEAALEFFQARVAGCLVQL